MKLYVVIPILNHLVETVQMRGHNISFYAELTKKYTYLSPNTPSRTQVHAYLGDLWGFDKATTYSRTSMARTLMARLPRLFRTRSSVHRKKSLGCRFGMIKCDFLFFILKTVYCVYSLESPRRGDSYDSTQYTFML